MITEAIEYYFLASKRATAAMNNIEAGAHLNRGHDSAGATPLVGSAQATTSFIGW